MINKMVPVTNETGKTTSKKKSCIDIDHTHKKKIFTIKFFDPTIASNSSCTSFG